MHVLHLARAGTSVLVVRVRRIRFNQLWSDRHRNDCHKGSFTHSSPEAGGLACHAGPHREAPTLSQSTGREGKMWARAFIEDSTGKNG